MLLELLLNITLLLELLLLIVDVVRAAVVDVVRAAVVDS